MSYAGRGPKLTRAGTKTIFLGDSITAGSFDFTNNLWGDGYVAYAALAAGSRVQYLKNAGVAGNTTAQMLSRLQTDVIANAPQRCVILGGTNDVTGAVAFATTTANLTEMYQQCIANGIEVVACTIPPNNTAADHAGVVKLNAWLHGYCANHGIPLVDFYRVLVDPATGNYKAAYTSDGTHPIVAGEAVMATEFAAQLPASFPPFKPWLVGANDAANESTNMIVNGTMQGTTRATSWVLNSALTNTTESLPTDANVVGNYQQVTFTGVNTYDLIQTISTGFSVGDKLAFAGVVSTSGVAGSGASFNIRVNATGAATAWGGINQLTGDVSNGTFYLEGTVPASTTALVVHFTVAGQNGVTVKLGQATLINLTTLGL